MTVISFFSAKGGTGKTVFNIMFASYLKYVLGRSVLVLDFDGPEYNFSYMRKRELGHLAGTGDAATVEAGLYMVDEVERTDEESICTIAGNIRSLDGAVDYVVMDFPGSFAANDAVCLLAMEQVIDFIVIPVELDGINIASSKSLARIFMENGQRTLLFFNRVHGKEKPELYAELRDWFGKNGIEVSHNIVKNSISMKKEMGANGFLRSTVCFPEKDILDRNPGIVSLFKEIMGYVEGGEKG